RVSKAPELFGDGSPEGIASPESANNAAVGGGLIPTLVLGIPGTPTLAIVIGAFLVQGIQPGPAMLSKQPLLFYGLLIGFLLTTIAMYLVGRYITRIFSRLLMVPGEYMISGILLVSLIGVYVSSQQPFDLLFALGVGFIGYVLKRLDYSPATFILAFILE